MYTQAIIFVVFSFGFKLDAVPPEACFANFRWEDCGGPPVRVLYYWKSGSRCEVGVWRGCLPNINMFKDEYDCVSTCIFTARAQPDDYHHYNDDVIEVSSIAFANATDFESTTAEDITTTVGDDNGGKASTAAASTGTGVVANTTGA